VDAVAAPESTIDELIFLRAILLVTTVRNVWPEWRSRTVHCSFAVTRAARRCVPWHQSAIQNGGQMSWLSATPHDGQRKSIKPGCFPAAGIVATSSIPTLQRAQLWGSGRSGGGSVLIPDPAEHIKAE
jgi:hypothetical protein